MSRFILLLAAVLTACLLPFPARTAPEKPRPLTLVYSGDVRGELEPCG